MREKLIECYLKSIDKCFNTKCRYCEYFSEPQKPVRRCQAAMVADDLIDNGVTFAEDNNVPSKWIPVKDRLPNYFEHVLINAPGDKPFTTVHEAHLRKDGLWDTGLYRYDKEDVTHWQPMPQPPKGE